MTDVDPLKAFLLERAHHPATDETGNVIRAIVSMWPDAMGQWSADQAAAALKMKAEVLLILARLFDWHPDFRPEWATNAQED